MKQRLIIFVILGVFILAVDTIFNNESENRITIFESEINSLISTWVEQVGREPTINEVEGIIKQLIDEEILYREAVRLGLDKNDIIIKRRLAQKIGFLRQEAETVLPTQDEVKEFYLKNIKRYLVRERLTFSHIYFSENDQSYEKAKSALKLIEAGESVANFGEPFLLGKNFSSKTIPEIERSFGLSFAEELQKVEIKSWTGPVTSEYGSHLVYLNSATESYTPSLDEVKNIVINDIILQKQNNAVKDYLTELRSEYEIEILADLNEISK